MKLKLSVYILTILFIFMMICECTRTKRQKRAQLFISIMRCNFGTYVHLFQQFLSNEWTDLHNIWNLSYQYTCQSAYLFSWWFVHAGACKCQNCASLLKWITVHVSAPYVRVRARIIMKINMLVDWYTDSLSFKFYEDPFTGCREI